MSVNLADGKKANLREIGNLDCSGYTQKKPVFDLGQKQVSFYFMVAIFLETIKAKDYDSLGLSLARL